MSFPHVIPFSGGQINRRRNIVRRCSGVAILGAAVVTELLP
jgi:hypothetical protein